MPTGNEGARIREASPFVPQGPTGRNTDHGRTASAIAAQGIKTADDFVKLMGAIICDVLEQRIDAESANAIAGIARQMLRAIEMQQRAQRQGESQK